MCFLNLSAPNGETNSGTPFKTTELYLKLEFAKRQHNFSHLKMTSLEIKPGKTGFEWAKEKKKPVWRGGFCAFVAQNIHFFLEVGSVSK